MTCPVEFRRYARRKNAVTLVSYFLWCTVGVLGLSSYQTRHENAPSTWQIVGWKAVFVVAVTLLSGFLVLRVWRVFQKPYTGEIVKVKLQKDYAAERSNATSFEGNFYLLTVQDDKGKRHRVKVRQSDGFFTYYQTGKRLAVYPRLPYPVCASDRRICPFCGKIGDENTCQNCQKSTYNY